MSNPISQKEIAYFLDRALPIAKMDVMRSDKDLPPIFIEGGDATSEMQEYLRKALKILASKAKNYGTNRDFGADLSDYFPTPHRDISDWLEQCVLPYKASDPFNFSLFAIHFETADAYENYQGWCVKNHFFPMAKRVWRRAWDKHMQSRGVVDRISINSGRMIWPDTKLRKIVME